MSHRNPEPSAAADAVHVAVLAKAPVAGLAKTRLAPVLGADGAARLQARFIEHAFATAKAAAIGPVTLWAAPDPRHPAFEVIAALHQVPLAEQPQGDLGARMLAALASARGSAMVIGTDCPALAAEHLIAAAAVLRDGVDVVIVPVEDGGYGLIGMRRAEPALFADMIWSTATVMAETRRRLARLGLSWREPARLWDVDGPEDLSRLEGEGFVGLMR
jgi:rSAM/selenodomain-associated transferase 1